MCFIKILIHGWLNGWRCPCHLGGGGGECMMRRQTDEERGDRRLRTRDEGNEEVEIKGRGKKIWGEGEDMTLYGKGKIITLRLRIKDKHTLQRPPYNAATLQRHPNRMPLMLQYYKRKYENVPGSLFDGSELFYGRHLSIIWYEHFNVYEIHAEWIAKCKINIYCFIGIIEIEN